jgi:hypothetical protein
MTGEDEGYCGNEYEEYQKDEAEGAEGEGLIHKYFILESLEYCDYWIDRGIKIENDLRYVAKKIIELIGQDSYDYIMFSILVGLQFKYDIFSESDI